MYVDISQMKQEALHTNFSPIQNTNIDVRNKHFVSMLVELGYVSFKKKIIQIVIGNYY